MVNQVVQYPHTAKIPGAAGESVQQPDGSWVITPGTGEVIQIGRYEPSTLNKLVQLTDGSKEQLKGIFYMPLTAPDVKEGTNFEVVGQFTTKVLFFTRGQLSCRVYL